MRSWLLAGIVLLQIFARSPAGGHSILANEPNSPMAAPSTPQTRSWNDMVEVDGKRQPRWLVWLKVIGFSCAIPLFALFILFAYWRLHLRTTSPISKMSSEEMWSRARDHEDRI